MPGPFGLLSSRRGWPMGRMAALGFDPAITHLEGWGGTSAAVAGRTALPVSSPQREPLMAVETKPLFLCTHTWPRDAGASLAARAME